MLIDTHCHLAAAEFAADREAVAAAARAAGVTRIVVPAVDTASFGAVSACCARVAGCVAAYGIHPLYVPSASGSDLLLLREWLERAATAPPPVVALGEIGLDCHFADTDVERQERFFVEQLRIAREFGLPVLLHVRRAVDRVLKYLRRVPVAGGIAHAFNGSRQQADEFIALGFRLGFGGALSFSRARHLRQLAATLPLQSIVLETDAPDMPPAWLAGGRNSPAELPRIGALLAELRDIDAGELARATSSNACAALPRLLSDD
ncbi:MAG TPA: TatD family hydrolase [Candidatus Accumulibacter phosphatis]|nr:MAG: putative deoxyribonuclease YjjV [Candidatus Accumulibacter sp. SK-11]HRL75788.1 TatD family hydrolase [Candidatus Accumulibacter phosphatis]HRQ94373.1 TatD family hydrolase [Candidatus Accumulibacter phosphatis]